MGILHRSLLTVSAPAASTLIVPISLVNSELGTSGVDTRLGRIIRATSALFTSPMGIGRPWARQTYVEQMPGRGGDILLTSYWPIESVTSIVDGAGTVAAAGYSIQGPRRDRVYRSDGWGKSAVPLRPHSPVVDGPDIDHTLTYVAGWLPPGGTARGAGTLTTWSATTAYVAGEFVKSATESNNDLLLECTTAGTSGGSEPTWPATAGSTVTDSGVTWTARSAMELPEELQEAALIQVESIFRGDLETPSNVKRDRIGPMETEFFDRSSGGSPLLPVVESILRMYR